MRGKVLVEHRVLSSQQASACGQFSVPMPGCHGPVLMQWVRPAALSTAFLLAIGKPIDPQAPRRKARSEKAA